MTRKVAEHDAAMSLLEDPSGIVRLSWTPGLKIDRELAEEAMRRVDTLNADRRRPLHVDMTGTATLTREARRTFTQPCSASRVALVGRSPVDRVIANFAVGVSSLPMPIRFFTFEPAAIAWLLDGHADT